MIDDALNVGTFYKRIKVMAPSSSSLDRFGQTMINYSTSSYWCNLKQVKGDEINTKGYVHSSAEYEFILRRSYNDYSLNEKCIINYNGLDYNVVYAEQVGKLYMRLQAKRRISNNGR